MKNAISWAKYIQKVFIPEIQIFHKEILSKVLVCLRDDVVEKEAASVEKEAWERLNELTGANFDLAEAAERAQEEGAEYFLMLSSFRQGMKNLCGVGLHHLVEQQQLFLLRRELLAQHEEDKHALLNNAEFIARSVRVGMNVSKFPGWNVLEELRHVANAIKHAEGRSVAYLRNYRPDLFRSSAQEFSTSKSPMAADQGVYKPLFGEDLYLKVTDLEHFVQGALKFWQSYAGCLLKLNI